MPKELILNSPRQLAIADYEDRALGPDDVRAEAILSGISHGTEMNLYSGNSPFEDRYFDPDLRLFLPRSEGKTAGASRIGYEWVGRVTEVGGAVVRFEEGDLVPLPFHHSQAHTFKVGQQTMVGKI